MPDLFFAVPGDLDTPTGGYGYDRRVIAELRSAGRQIEILDLGPGFPKPNSATRAKAGDRLRSLPGRAPLLIDGLAFGVLSEIVRHVATRHPLVALIHHPLALETGLGEAEAKKLAAGEREALALAAAVIATSGFTADLLVRDYGVPRDRIVRAEPGTDPVAPARGSGEAAPVLLNVGAVVPRKGQDLLIAALNEIRARPWRLIVAGDLTRAPDHVATLRAQIAALELGDRVTLAGAVPAEALAGLYDGADLFVSASHFEGYGMACAEAIACGLPVVATRGGAAANLLTPALALTVEPGDQAGLAAALGRVLDDPALRKALGAGARAAAGGLPRWSDTAAIIAACLDRLP